LATVPVVGALAYGVYKKQKHERMNRDISDVFQISKDEASFLEPVKDGEKIRLGIIGFGIRGKQLLRAAGFAEPSWIDSMIEANKQNKKDTRYEQYVAQDDLNIEINVSAIFLMSMEKLLFWRIEHQSPRSNGVLAKRRNDIAITGTTGCPDSDAVIIATPDHWHSTMAMEASRAGKHVYCEKPLSWTVPETYMVRQAIRETGVVFHSDIGRQTDCYQKASKSSATTLGPVNLIEVCTNRNSPNVPGYTILLKALRPKRKTGHSSKVRKNVEEYMEYMTKHNLEKNRPKNEANSV
jgi:hypothetical protein